MRRFGFLCAILFLSGCVDWPDVPVSPTADAADWPELLPLDEIGAPPTVTDNDAAIETLENRAEALRARAQVLRQPVEDDAAMERLRRLLDR